MITGSNHPIIVIHGGLIFRPKSVSTNDADRKDEAILAAVDLAASILRAGGSSVDACAVAVRSLEDNELFNAGYGASLNLNGEVELDAMVMCGRTLRLGSVALVRHVRHPIDIATRLLNNDRVSCLAGADAEHYAADHKLPIIRNADLISARSRNIFSGGLAKGPNHGGTIGAVAMDSAGNLAVCTSSGGVPFKHPGRLADTCMPGVGAYASNMSAAVAVTGHGETILRLTVARDLCSMMEYAKLPLSEASARLSARIRKIGGLAAFIAIDRYGNFSTGGGLPNLPWAVWKLGDSPRIYRSLQ